MTDISNDNSSNEPTPSPAVQLEWVLGANPTSIHVLGSAIPNTKATINNLRVTYISGNVGIIYNTVNKTQTLLRGHRNPLRTCILTPDRNTIVTACSGTGNSIIFWEASTGSPIAMIESPHTNGTIAMAFSTDGRYLVTLSVPAVSTSSIAVKVQELCIWDCQSIFSNTNNDDYSPTPRLLASTAVPVNEEQITISISSRPLSIVANITNGPIQDNPHSLSNGILTGGFEIITTGTHSIVFYVATCTAIKDTEAGAALLKQGTTDMEALAAAARNATKDIWNIVCDVPDIPKAPVSTNIDKATGRPLPPEKRNLRASVFLSGHYTKSLSTVDDHVMDLTNNTALVNTMGGLHAHNTTSSSSAVGGSGIGAIRALKNNKEVLIPPTGSYVVAASGTGDGALLLWQQTEHLPTNASSYTSIKDAALRLVRKTCLKTMKLTLPETIELDANKKDTVTDPHAKAINVLLPTPNGKNLVIGANDGGIRIYDLNMHLVGWYDNLNAGGITALNFIPGHSTDIVRSTTAVHHHHHHHHEETTVTAPHRVSNEVPDLAIATSRSLILSLSISSFDDGDEVQKQGVVLLEGPDASVTGLTAYPYSPYVALAIASGIIQLWDYTTKTLLLVRELSRANDGLSDRIMYPPNSPTPPPLYTPTAIATDPRQRYIAVGTSEGVIFILNPSDLTDAQLPLPYTAWPRPTHIPTSTITKLVFSEDGYHLAAADSGHHVYLYRFVRKTERHVAPGAEKANATSRLANRRPWEEMIDDAGRFQDVIVDSWEFIGRVKAHSDEITGLNFSPFPSACAAKYSRPMKGAIISGFTSDSFWPAGTILGDSAIATKHDNNGLCQLISLSSDRHMVIYDIGSSSIKNGLQIRNTTRTKLEQYALPTSCIFNPVASIPIDGDDSGNTTPDSTIQLTIASNAYKFKQWSIGSNTQAPLCTSTFLAPTFGGSVTHMTYLPSSTSTAVQKRYFGVAYATDDRIVGVIATPLNGNPFGVAGVVGHTGPVTGLAASFDGTQLFTAGHDTSSNSSSGSVCIWGVSESSLNKSVQSGGTGMTPYLSLFEGGVSGQQYTELCDYFSYAQIHAQGEGSTAPRRAGITLPIAELPAVMRSMGFFPTNEELNILTTEARLLSLANNIDSESVELSTVVRLFVNHKPVTNASRDKVVDAIQTIMNHPISNGETDGQGSIRWGGLTQILSSKGEIMNNDEIMNCLKILLGNNQDDAHNMSASLTKTQSHSSTSSPRLLHHHSSTSSGIAAPLIDDDELLTKEELVDRILQMNKA